MAANLFFIALEFFTAFYSGIPGHRRDLQYLFFGLDGHTTMVPWMWTSVTLMAASLPLLVASLRRKSMRILAAGCALVFLSTWIDKGLGLIAGGLAVSPLETVVDYAPTVPEVLISLGIYAAGALILTLLYRIVLSVRGEAAGR